MLLRLNFWMLLLQGVDERRCCCCSLLLGWCCCCVGLLLMLRVATIAVGTKDTVLDSNLSLTNWNMGQGGGGGGPALFVIGERGRGLKRRTSWSKRNQAVGLAKIMCLLVFSAPFYIHAACLHRMSTCRKDERCSTLKFRAVVAGWGHYPSEQQ